MFIKTYLVALIVFLGIDMVWLTAIAKDFYHNKIGYLMSSSPNLIAALVFYLIYIGGLTYLILMPALEKKSLAQAIISGAIFGLVAYATYDLTNLATIKNWPVDITIIDLIWGTTLSALVSGITFLIASKL